MEENIYYRNARVLAELLEIKNPLFGILATTVLKFVGWKIQQMKNIE